MIYLLIMDFCYSFLLLLKIRLFYESIIVLHTLGEREIDMRCENSILDIAGRAVKENGF